MFQTSEILLNKKALEQNFSFLKKRLKKDIRISSVIKGNAYGHGIEEFVPLAEEFGIRHFSVFNANEAWRARKTICEDSAVMIMGMIDNEELKWAIQNEVEFFVFELDRLEAALKYAKKQDKKARVHLEVETGMNRTGLEENVFPKALELMKEHSKYLQFEGLCTHYAGAESVGNYLRIQEQIKRFKGYREMVEEEGLQPNYYHTACSAAALTYPETQMDMVRIGIAQYGLWPSKETWMHVIKELDEKRQDPLNRVISWKSKIMSVKKVKAGEFVGYGTTFMASNDMLMATAPVGYANGFARSLSNVGRVLVNGVRCSVIGIVNMNMMMIDAIDVPDVKKGDEVVLIGEQDKLDISLSSFGELSNQLNYELLTRLPLDIPRFVR